MNEIMLVPALIVEGAWLGQNFVLLLVVFVYVACAFDTEKANSFESLFGVRCVPCYFGEIF